MNVLPYHATVVRLLRSGWPSAAIVHLLRSNHFHLNPRWLRVYVKKVGYAERKKRAI